MLFLEKTIQCLNKLCKLNKYIMAMDRRAWEIKQ